MGDHGSQAEHTALVHDALKMYGREDDLVLWGNSKVTMVKGVPHAKPGLQIGASDIIGMLRWEFAVRQAVYNEDDTGNQVTWESPPAIARFCAFEAKTGGARASASQRMFMETVRRFGGFACVFRSADEFGAALGRAREGKCE